MLCFLVGVGVGVGAGGWVGQLFRKTHNKRIFLRNAHRENNWPQRTIPSVSQGR